MFCKALIVFKALRLCLIPYPLIFRFSFPNFILFYLKKKKKKKSHVREYFKINKWDPLPLNAINNLFIYVIGSN